MSEDRIVIRSNHNVVRIQTLLRVWVMVVLQTFIEWYISRQDENWPCLLKNWTNGQLRTCIIAWKRQKLIIKVEDKRASGKTLIAQVISFAVMLPHFWKMISCFHMLLKVIIMATSLLVSSLCISVFTSQYWIDVFCTYEEFRSELLTL